MALSPIGEITYLALALSRCASGAQAIRPETPPALSRGDEIDGYVELVDALRLAGATASLV